MFELLSKLGAWFSQKSDFHKHTLDESFEILSEFCAQIEPNNSLLQELLAIDYYLHFKVKPKTKFLEEIDRSKKTALMNSAGLNHHKYRFMAFDIQFNWEKFAATQEIVLEPQQLVVQYSGTQKAQIASLIA